MKIVFAKEFRNNNRLQEIPDKMNGWYRWWAPVEAVENLLNSPYVHNKYFSDIVPFLTKRKFNNIEYYYIYTGISKSLRARLDWHINQKHRESNVKNGTLSTLRQTISSLVAGNQYDEKATNELIDMLIIEYSVSEGALAELEQNESVEITNNVLPLNIKDNFNPILKYFKNELKAVRNRSK